MRPPKIILSLLCVLCLSNCLAVKGEGYAGIVIGSDLKGLDMSASGTRVESMEQSPAIKHGADTLRDVTRLRGWFRLGNAALTEGVKIGKDLVQ